MSGLGIHTVLEAPRLVHFESVGQSDTRPFTGYFQTLTHLATENESQETLDADTDADADAEERLPARLFWSKQTCLETVEATVK